MSSSLPPSEWQPAYIMMDKLETIKGRAAIMQPYFFPYIGYYQMAAAVERFLIYDDVNYINRGYINRNRLLVNGKEWHFTVPLSGASQNKLIKDVGIDMTSWDRWKRSFLRTVDMNYNKALNYGPGRELLEEVLTLKDDRITSLAQRSVQLPLERMGRSIRFQRTSELGLNTDLRREERLIYICKELGITQYIQSQGGTVLYSSDHWHAKGLSLQFIRPTSMEYSRDGEWPRGLSMLDAMLHVPFNELAPLLDQYEFFTN